MFEISFFQIADRHIHFRNFESNRNILNGFKGQAIFIHDRHIAVVQIDHAIGVIHNWSGIWTNKILAATNSDNQWTSFSGSNQLIFFIVAIDKDIK